MTWGGTKTMGAEAATSSDWNTYIRDNFKALGDSWATYSPALSNWTLGNGTLSGFYVQTGKMVWCKILYTVGSTDTKSGNLVISLPATKVTDNNGTTMPLAGTALAYDTSAGLTNIVFPTHATTTGVRFYSAAGTLVAAGSPWTWATGDELNTSFWYEAA